MGKEGPAEFIYKIYNLVNTLADYHRRLDNHLFVQLNTSTKFDARRNYNGGTPYSLNHYKHYI